MDGTLLNSKGQVSYANANALREAMSRGIQVIIATGKTHMGAMNILKTVGLIGRDGVLSKSSPGVFIQGLLVYGRNGQEIFRRNLDPDFYREAFLYSLKHEIPLVAYCGDRCLTLFDHPLVEAVHSVYCEPKAEIMPTVESLLAAAEIQKLLFLESIDDRISAILSPYWSKEAGDHANVIQAIPETLELVPHGTSKGDGVKLLLDHLGASSKEIARMDKNLPKSFKKFTACGMHSTRRSWQLAMEKMALKCSGWLGLELLSAMDQRRQKLLLM